MSQKKVDAYKKEKANRSQIIKREKRILLLEKIVAILICIVLVCWVGISIYHKTKEKPVEEIQDTQINVDALNDYIENLTAE